MDARQFIVEAPEAGSRLDRWLTGKLPEFSRGQIKHLLDHGRILVNHRRVLIANWELEIEDCIEVRMPLGGVPEVKEPEKRKWIDPAAVPETICPTKRKMDPTKTPKVFRSPF